MAAAPLQSGRVVLDRPTEMWVNDLFADRLIYATSRAAGVALVSKDRRLHNYAQRSDDATVIWWRAGRRLGRGPSVA